MEQPGKLIVFEGPDGVGKTTLVQNTVSLLEDLSIPFISLSFPGKTPGTLGFVVDQIHHIPKQFQLDSIEPLALQALHVAAHLDTIETKIRPAIHRGLVVVLRPHLVVHLGLRKSRRG
jgi:dTMP kinase